MPRMWLGSSSTSGAAAIALLLGVGAGAWAVQPDVRVGSADARPGTGLDLAAGERAVWIRTVRASASFSAAGPHAVIIRSGERELGRSRFYVAEAPPEGAFGA